MDCQHQSKPNNDRLTLIATAIGIAVAVPAVVAYNFFIRRNKVIWAYLDDFALDFIHLALKSSFIIEKPSNKSAIAASTRLTEVSSSKKSGSKEATTHDELTAKEALA